MTNMYQYAIGGRVEMDDSGHVSAESPLAAAQEVLTRLDEAFCPEDGHDAWIRIDPVVDLTNPDAAEVLPFAPVYFGVTVDTTQDDYALLLDTTPRRDEPDA